MRILSRVVGVVLAAWVGVANAEEAIDDGQFYFGDQAVKIADLKRRDVYAFLAGDWAKFDKHATDTVEMFTGKKVSIDWRPVITPPFPTTWPPQQPRSIAYYAYAEYQEAMMHGPVISRSAPWAKVVLNEGEPAKKVLLAADIGPVVHGEGSVPISQQQASRKIQIIKDGEAHLANFVRWAAIPDDEAEVKAIREYYCQWALTDRTAALIKDDHKAFFEWLSCPPPTRVPVLP